MQKWLYIGVMWISLFLYRQPLNETFYEVRRLTDEFLHSVQYLIP